MDVNEGSSGSPFEYDQVNIICPLYDQRITPNEVGTEKFIIYHVNKEEYDSCRIMSAHPRIIANCDKPYSLQYFTISFRSFSPTPGALEFHAGTDYYFISTSSHSDLHRRVDGMCRSHNMKMVFKVADKKKNQKIQTESASNVVFWDEKNSIQSKEDSKLAKKRLKESAIADLKVDREFPSLADITQPTFTPKTDDQLEEEKQESNGDIFVRKEPKSLDYYLYQTRTNSISNEGNKLSKSSGAFKQEASTGSAVASTAPFFKIYFLISFNFCILLVWLYRV